MHGHVVTDVKSQLPYFFLSELCLPSLSSCIRLWDLNLTVTTVLSLERLY